MATDYSKLRRRLAISRFRHLEQDAESISHAFRGQYSESPDEPLAQLLEFVTHSVPYYRRFQGSTLKEFPVQDKNSMRTIGLGIISDGHRNSRLKQASTSGSTGTPFTAYFDDRKAGRRLAGTVANLATAGADPFGPLVYARAWESVTKLGRVKLHLKPHFPYGGRRSISTAAEAVAWIQKQERVALTGYASYLEDLFHEIDEQELDGIAGKVSAVIGTSELETNFLYEASRRIASCTARMRYSNMENGIIAMTGAISGQYQVDQSSFFVEILDEYSDQPAPRGQVGRIVLTDFFNHAMPFIRYDTGDTGRFLVDASGSQNRGIIVDLQGRRLDVLWGGTASSPRRLHALRIWGPTASLGELRQFQLRQNDFSDFTWILNAERSRSLEGRLSDILESTLSERVSCRFEYSDDVPVLASGKRQFFVSAIKMEGEGR